MNIAFFDFDGTMIKGDSLLSFVAFVHGKKKLYIGLALRFYILLGYKLGICSNSYAKEQLIGYFFTGMDYEEFLRACKAFANVLEQRIRPAALERIKWHKQKGDTIAMVSASFEEYLKPLCKKLNIDCIATQLEVIYNAPNNARANASMPHINTTTLNKLSLASSTTPQIASLSTSQSTSHITPSATPRLIPKAILSGKFATPNCYGAQKVARINAAYAIHTYAEIYAYGDSKGDAEMLHLATHAFYKPFNT